MGLQQRVVFCPKRLFVPSQFLSAGSSCVDACCLLSVSPFRVDLSPRARVVVGYAALPASTLDTHFTVYAKVKRSTQLMAVDFSMFVYIYIYICIYIYIYIYLFIYI